jgi:glutaredoxin-like protein NrdH
MKVIVYTKPNCKDCDSTKFQFNRFGIPFEERSAIDCIGEIQQFGYRSAPVVVVTPGHLAGAERSSWSGFRYAAICELRDALKGEATA